MMRCKRPMLNIVTYLFRHGNKSAPFGHKWRISAPRIVINNPKIIDLFSYKFYVGPHKGGFGIVNYNSIRTYCPLVPKHFTRYVNVHLSLRVDISQYSDPFLI